MAMLLIEKEGPPGLVERIRHDRCERMAGVTARQRGEHARASQVDERASARSAGVGSAGGGAPGAARRAGVPIHRTSSWIAPSLTPGWRCSGRSGCTAQ